MKRFNNKSSYFKLYTYSIALITLCLIVIGILTTNFSTRQFKNARYESISSACDVFLNSFRDEYAKSNNINTENIVQLFNTSMRKYNMELYLYDRYGNCLLAPNGSSSRKLSSDMIRQINNGTAFDINASEVSDSEPMLVYGDRFSVQPNNSDERIRFYITAYSSADSINAFTMKMVVFIVLSGAVLLTLVITVMRFRFRKYQQASADFLRISEKYSKGDFSERLDIKAAGDIRDVAKFVNNLADYAESSEERSKTFIANVSHELRTPITTIGGFVSGILDSTIPKSSQNEYLYLVSNEIKRLSILITSMLNMSRFESGTMKPSFVETNLTELVIQTVFMFEKKIEEKRLDIEGLDSDRLMAVVDPNLMQQVIYNLVENAVKFVNEGGKISFAFEKNSDGICSFAIRNSGEGLKNEEIQRVFDRFYKTDESRGKDKTGLGLGLSISRKIVHLHHGHIVVKSVYGEYTEFSVQIPHDASKKKK